MKKDQNVWILDSDATYHVCSSLQESSSFQHLQKGEIKLKVGTEDVISASVLGDVKLFFRNKFFIVENLNIVPKIKRNLISISCLLKRMYSINFSLNEAFISKNGIHICIAKLENNLYVLRPNEEKVILNYEILNTVND